MKQKLAFEVTRAGASGRFAIRLLDDKQIAALALAEGCAKSLAQEPLVVCYDEGGGELVPVDGFDDSTARGRIVLKVLGDVYCAAVRQIQADAHGGAPAPPAEIFVFQSSGAFEPRARRAGA